MRDFRPSVDDTDSDYAIFTSYINLVVTAFGLIGNMFVIKLMMNKEMKLYSCTIFFIALAATDSIVLGVEAVNEIAVHIENQTVYTLLYGNSAWRCRFGVFAYEMSRTSSSWLVVALAAELVLAATNPMRRHKIYTKHRATYVTLAVLLIALAATFPFLVITTKTDSDGRCTSYYKAFHDIYSNLVLRCVSQNLAPVAVITVCMTVTWYHCRKASRSTAYITSSTYDISTPTSSQMSTQSGQTNDTQPNGECQALYVILLVTATFIFTTSPSSVVDTAFALKQFFPAVTLTFPDWDMAWYVSRVLLFVNFSVKFYLILLAGPEFRAALGGTGLRLGFVRTLSGAHTESTHYRRGSHLVRNSTVKANRVQELSL